MKQNTLSLLIIIVGLLIISDAHGSASPRPEVVPNPKNRSHAPVPGFRSASMPSKPNSDDGEEVKDQDQEVRRAKGHQPEQKPNQLALGGAALVAAGLVVAKWVNSK